MTRSWVLGSGFATFLVWSLAGCKQNDVGAPCNHGQLSPPREPVITFPALACDQLLCVYGEDVDPPAGACEQDIDCALEGATETFACVEGTCRLRPKHVLERSMCSRYCSSDADCASTAKGTACETGFACAPLMSLGDQCCEKVCTCRDDLDVERASKLAKACAEGTAPGC